MARPVGRREAIAGVGAAVASAGCVGRVRNLAGRDRGSQLELEIRTTPADEDPKAIRIARALADNLTAVGIDARVDTLGRADLRRAVLFNHDFDVYVGQFEETESFDPDALYALVHSRFTAESGWQNPFGLTELAVDDLLDRQRRVDGAERSRAVSDLQRAVCEVQPFTVVAFPDALTAVRTERFEGWGADQPVTAGGLLSLERAGETASDEATTLRLVTADGRITTNWNPIAAEYRRHGTFTSLLYDRLAETGDGAAIPWLADGWERIDEETLRVTLRDAAWHDGEPVTAADVAFSYAFLRDTSMGALDTPVSAPQFRGRSSVVTSTTVVDGSTVELTVGDANRSVTERALQVPVLPEHVWSERTGAAAVAGIELSEDTTEALVSNNEDPVGSGPVRFVESTPGESVTFERNPDHFLARLDAGGDDGDGSTEDDAAEPGGRIPDEYRGKPAFDRLEIRVVPSDIAAVQMVGDGLADGTASNLGPDSVPRIGREADTRLVAGRSAAFYHVGYNTRRAPLSNPRFRAVLASLVDKERLVDEAFGGYARPAASPLAASPRWVPDDLEWGDGPDPTYPFRGTDGELDVGSARDALREAGYRFDESGELLARDQ